jgi:2-keto-3-deoxygluconate permease
MDTSIDIGHSPISFQFVLTNNNPLLGSGRIAEVERSRCHATVSQIIKINISHHSLVTTIIPFLLGMLFGNIDPSFTKMVSGGTPVFLFFMGITCGSTINWFTLFSQLGGGILLSILYFVISLPIMLFVDRVILKRPGYAAASMTSMSPVSIIMPAAVAEAVPEYAPFADTAAAQIALAVAITSILTPFICNWVLKKWGGAQ